jgi:dihydroflavonol-4-reductase
MDGTARTIAITGATGFVGRRVVKRLLREPDIVLRCLVRPKSDTRELESLSPLVVGAWGVINLAGYRDFWSPRPELYHRLNTRGAENVFRAALDANVEKVVQVSTPLAFGVPNEIPFDEDSPPGPHPSQYARSKYLADQIGWRMHSEKGLPLTVVHLAAVIGAGDPRPTMEVRRAVERRLPVLVGADTTYTYVHVDVGRRYLIGTERASTREYFSLIGDLAGVPVPKYSIPEALLIPVARLLERFARRSGKRPVIPVDILKTTAAGSLVFDGSRAKTELGMTYRSLRTALSEAIDEIRSESPS